MSYSVRCRYCAQALLAAEQLGERESVAIRAHLEACCPNAGPLPGTIGELLCHLRIRVERRQVARQRLRARHRFTAVPARLLIVTDDSTVAQLGTSAGGQRVRTASDAVEALRAFHDAGMPDAIVLDPLLPRDGAWVFASWLARDARAAQIPRYVIDRDVTLPDTAAAFAGTRVDEAALRALLEGRAAP